MEKTVREDVGKLEASENTKEPEESQRQKKIVKISGRKEGQDGKEPYDGEGWERAGEEERGQKRHTATDSKERRVEKTSVYRNGRCRKEKYDCFRDRKWQVGSGGPGNRRRPLVLGASLRSS